MVNKGIFTVFFHYYSKIESEKSILIKLKISLYIDIFYKDAPINSIK
jgi:hypothetical protein